MRPQLPSQARHSSIAAEHLGPWASLSPEQAAELLSPVEASWWIAGGWALDLLVGHQTRTHADLDILILRPDHRLFRSHLHDWDVHAADPPGSLRPWPVSETLPSEAHDVWCRRNASAPWSFQFVIEHVDGEERVFRREEAIRRPVASLSSRASRPGMPVLAPDVQLLYKSKGMREKGAADFDTVLPYLAVAEREWLRRALLATRPDHEWIERL
ncbi:MAG: amino acid transporter [Actinomycetota bacterium]|nr:amino acid transporter [Actinomycetota bacterium]